MKLKFLPFAAAVLATAGISNPIQAVTVDGVRNVGEYTGIGAAVVNQATVSNWSEAGVANIADICCGFCVLIAGDNLNDESRYSPKASLKTKARTELNSNQGMICRRSDSLDGEF